jgi:predicted ribosomally synthesized peptide with SipW-like signal peptide
MKKIFLSFAVIIAVSSFSFLLTKAYFSDKKTSSGNKFTVGTLNLEVGGSDGGKVEPFTISELGDGEIKGQKIWKLKNNGSLPGQLIINFDNISNNENGCNAPESEVDQTCDNPGPGEGELGNVLSANFSIDNVSKISVPLTSAGAQTLLNYWKDNSNILVLAPNQEVELKIDWFESSPYGNEIQSDSLAFDINFDLQQVMQ